MAGHRSPRVLPGQATARAAQVLDEEPLDVDLTASRRLDLFEVVQPLGDGDANVFTI